MSGDWRRLTEFAGFPVVHRKPLGSLVGPQSQGRRLEVASGWFDRWVFGIMRLASMLSKFAVVGHPSDGAKTKIPKVPLGGVYPSVRLRGSFVFLLPPYNPSGERMPAISWNPSSFCFAISSFFFLWNF
jgi:hypothetical protein